MPRPQHYRTDSRESWKPYMYRGPQAVAEFRSIGICVPLAQIYEGTLAAATNHN
jgi:hypothetical protein